MPSPRRTFLRRSAAALLAGATAGCLSDGTTTATDDPAGPAGDADTATPTATPATETPGSPSTDSATATGTETDAVTATPAADALGNADYTEWLPAPAAFDRDGYGFTSVAPRDILARESDLGGGATEGLRDDLGVPAVDSLTDTAAFHQLRPGVLVFEADLDRGSAAGDLRDSGFTEAETRHGFAVFTGDGGAAALADAAVVLALGTGDPDAARSVVEAVVDAKAGAGTRYVDAAADCERLTAALGSAHLLSGRTHSADEGLDGAVASGFGIEIGERETNVRAPAVFPEGEVDEATLAEWAADAGAFYGQSVETAVDGRVVTARATVPTGEVEQFRQGMAGESPRGGSRAPQVAFGFEYEPTGDGAGRLAVTHEGGDSVPGAELFVRGAGFADVDGVDQTAAGRWQGTASGDGATVVAGDSVAVGVASDYEISVVWEPEDGNTSATIGEDVGPDA